MNNGTEREKKRREGEKIGIKERKRKKERLR